MDSVVSGLARSPVTPTRAKSVGPRKGSMEDAESSNTRKRPRLDSGDRAYRSMSADPLRATTSEGGPPNVPATTPGDYSSSRSHEAAEGPPVVVTTPSKVTINVREPAATVSQTSSQKTTDDRPSTQAGALGDDGTSSRQASAPIMNPSIPKVVSAASSPPNSPEIEVAEVEDMNDAPVETKWMTLTSSTCKTGAKEARDLQALLLQGFPRISTARNMKHALSIIAGALQKDDLGDGHLLRELGSWTESYIQATGSHASQWWDMVQEEREFWDEFPVLVEAIAHRSGTRSGTLKLLYPGDDTTLDDQSPLQIFLVAYTSLALRMAQIDQQTLTHHFEDAEVAPDLISERHLQALCVIANYGCPLWKGLVEAASEDCKVVFSAMFDRFMQDPDDGVALSINISRLLLDRSPGLPLLFQKFFAHMNIMNRLLHQCRTTHYSTADGPLEPDNKDLTSQAYPFFQEINSKFEDFISKQVPALTIEVSQGLVSQLSMLLRNIAASDEDFTQRFISERSIQNTGPTKEETLLLVELAWKFDILKRCIVDGRMEIRVQGVEAMQHELVNLYTKYLQHSPAPKDHPVAEYVSNFMLTSKLVEYFVGVESHPQLISRCGNIVGFLIVTQTYNETESDVIWRAVTTSQDPRFVDALLLMLSSIFNISQYPVLLYLTTKLNELPIHAFDSTMLKFGRLLLDHLRRMWKPGTSGDSLDMPPFHLCIRLIRQAAVERSLEISKRREIHHFAAVELAAFLQLGPSGADRKIIYQECIRDILERTDFATGSISALDALLAENYEREFSSLIQEWNVAQLVVKEFDHMIEAEKATVSSAEMLDDRLTVRLNLIQNIILYIPDTITSDVGTHLWECTVGANALSRQARELAWSIFIRIIKCVPTRNSFIDKCIREHLPKIDARHYSEGCLRFVQEVNQYHHRIGISQPADIVKFEVTAGDLLWQMSLAAPSGSVEFKAIGTLVALHLDSPETQRRSRAENEAIHMSVVERCVSQLTSAASKLKAFSDETSSGEDEPMVIVVSEKEVESERLSFSRSLAILKEFIRGVRSRPRYSPHVHSQPQVPTGNREMKGGPIQIRYQLFGIGITNDIRTLEVGQLETVQEFILRLKSLSGFPKFTLINGGQKLDLNVISNRTLHDLKLDQKGLIIVKKDPDSDSVTAQPQMTGLRPVETEVLTHFSDFYEFLAMEQRHGKEVFEFLVTFPPHESIITLITSRDTHVEAIFPAGAPFKILYSVYTFKQYLAHQMPNSDSRKNLTSHGIRSLTTALSTLSLNVGPHGHEADTTVAAHLLDCLNTFLKEPPSPDTAEILFATPQALFERLRSLIRDGLAIHGSPDADVLVSICFAALLKISLRSAAFWAVFKTADVCPVLLKRLLLEEPNWQIRRRVADYVKAICNDSHRPQTGSAEDFVPQLWNHCASIIPCCLQNSDTSHEFFDVASTLFQCIEQPHRDELDLALYAQSWSKILLQHQHEEFVGRDSIDWLVFGLSSLLNWVFQCAKSQGSPLSVPDDLLVDLFRTHLFPETRNLEASGRTKARVPILHSYTRQELYSIILVLSNNASSYQNLMVLVRDLLSQGEDSHAFSWGIAQILEDFPYEMNWSVERDKSIRSPTGYPGLRNLSNTCYMNSLFAQLFMNVNFRAFMLGTNVMDPVTTQRLLHETQSLFGYMQETMLKSVDSQGIVESLVTYENTLIDVTVQMDVDEFYNLLFDRWEGQIYQEDSKKQFRGFYGGQIVQQIKSKECPHISERLEPFSAIQCDIQGKPTLIDSLNAYVSGETMEGDNKYSCTSCGCYVDAVKRACLKDIPDNLIFHLKRFDYDVMTGMRSKINDVFEFPHEIDMAPYHVDNQHDTKSPDASDVFELVGVLVHSGTAESGHYYSYILERPTNSALDSSWVEFNDVEVTKFDPNNIADQCFGGYSEPTAYSSRYVKHWNAYMLFYERVKLRKVENKAQSLIPMGVPAKCAVPADIEDRVASTNAEWLRYYCMFDPAHAAFTRQLLEQLRHVNNGTCSESHDTEKEAIWLSLDYLERVLARSKDCSDFAKTLSSLTRVIGTCATCCKLALEWVVSSETALRNLLLRCPNAKVRKDFATMIVVALKYLKKNQPQWYGFSEEDNVYPSTEPLHKEGMFPRIVSRLGDLWACLYSHARAWDDYFSLLTELSNIGVHEIHTLLNQKFLQYCLEILVVDHARGSRLRTDNAHYGAYTRFMEKGRKYSLTKLVELLASLLEKVDLTIDSIRRIQDRDLDFISMPLTHVEDELMQLGSDSTRSRNLCVFLEKILSTVCNPPATQRIVKVMTLAEPQFGLLEVIQKTILSGINIEPAHLAAPFLEAAITFCEANPSPDSAQIMIRSIAGEVDTIGDYGGREHMDFFIRARRLVSLRDNFEQGFFNRIVLRTVPQWAPALLQYREYNVRDTTLDLLRHLVFNHDLRNMDDEEHADLVETAAKDLQIACTRRCHSLVQEQKPVDRQNVDQIIKVIQHCLEHYYTADDDQRPIVEAQTIIAALEVLTVSDVDEAASDAWNNASDDVPTDSDSEFLTTSP